MAMAENPESVLGRATWSDEDLDVMSWNGCRIRALAVDDVEGPPDGLTREEYQELDDLDDTAPPALQLRLDLDYIVRRTGPPGYGYWVAPATLTFHCVDGLSGDLRCLRQPMELRQLHRVTPVVPRDEARWHLEGRDFDLRFQAWSFVLHLRRPPRHGDRVLRMAERGGISFEARPFA